MHPVRAFTAPRSPLQSDRAAVGLCRAIELIFGGAHRMCWEGHARFNAVFAALIAR